MAIGVVAGLVGSLMLGRALAGLLFEVRPGDPIVMLGASTVVLLATVVACIAPAQRAARIGAGSERHV